MAKSRGNGQGSVTKIKDTKGKIKYQVRITVGSEFDAEKEKFRYISKSLGVYKTKAEAEAVLAEYNSSPYDLTVNYKVGMFKPQDMLELIEKLYTTSEVGNKFIFSCRACGTKMSKASVKMVHM